jgi:hypothetical protein
MVVEGGGGGEEDDDDYHYPPLQEQCHTIYSIKYKLFYTWWFQVVIKLF